MFVLLLCPTAKAISYQAAADSLMKQLKFQKTPQDSLKLLYNIFDASDQSKKFKPGKMALQIARRTNDQEALIELVPYMACL